MEPLVSIVIPCYNAERWVAEALKSVQVQTWARKEIILVDDGSTDGSVKAAEALALPGLKIFRQDNQGPSAARNRALAEAQGEYIQYLDADDLMVPDKIALQVRLLQDQGPGFLASGEWARCGPSPQEARFRPGPLWQDAAPLDWLVRLYGTQDDMMPLSAWLVPRPVAERAGPWNVKCRINDDGEYFCRVVLASQGIKFCPGARVYYRVVNASSLSQVYSHQEMEWFLSAVELIAQHLLDRENSPRTRQAAARAFQRFIYAVYRDKQVMDLVQIAEEQVRRLGGSDLRPGGGKAFQFLVSLLGWKRAMDIKNYLRGGK